MERRPRYELVIVGLLGITLGALGTTLYQQMHHAALLHELLPALSRQASACKDVAAQMQGLFRGTVEQSARIASLEEAMIVNLTALRDNLNGRTLALTRQLEWLRDELGTGYAVWIEAENLLDPLPCLGPVPPAPLPVEHPSQALED